MNGVLTIINKLTENGRMKNMVWMDRRRRTVSIIQRVTISMSCVFIVCGSLRVKQLKNRILVKYGGKTDRSRGDTSLGFSF